jgi:hypothetical protein
METLVAAVQHENMHIKRSRKLHLKIIQPLSILVPEGFLIFIHANKEHS